MRPTMTAAACALMLTLAACTKHSGSAAATSESCTDSPMTGTLTGLVRMYGGPLNPQTGKQSLNGAPGPHWTLRVLSGGETVAKGTSDAAGRFRFSLPPGRYTLACGQEPRVVIEAGQTVSVDCRVPVR